MALQRDLIDHLNVVNLLLPATHGIADTLTAAIDTDFMRDGILAIHCGAYGAGATLGIQLITSDEAAGTYADVLAADLALTEAADEDSVHYVAVKDMKRYVMLQYNVSVGDVLFGAVLIGSRRPENPPN